MYKIDRGYMNKDMTLEKQVLVVMSVSLWSVLIILGLCADVCCSMRGKLTEINEELYSQD